jgi:ubiquinone biosynthesis protein
MWTAAEPVVKQWLESQIGPEAQFMAAAEGAASVGKFMGDIPRLLGRAERTADAFAAMAEDGVRLDDDTVARLAEAQGRQNRVNRIAIWIGAVALAAIALSLLL